MTDKAITTIIQKVSQKKQIPIEEIDFNTTKQLIIDSCFPVVQTINHQQIFFEDMISEIDKELYQVQPVLSNLQPLQGVFEYKFANETKQFTHNFMISGTYETYMRVCINLIKMLPTLFEKSYLEYFLDYYKQYLLGPVKGIHEIINLVNTFWDYVYEIPETMLQVTKLPLEEHYSCKDLIKIILDIIFHNLYSINSVECYCKVLVVTVILQEQYKQLNNTDAENFLYDIVKEILLQFIYQFLYTDDLLFNNVKLEINDGSYPVLSDDELLLEYAKSDQLSKLQLQSYIPDRLKSRAFLTMCIYDNLKFIASRKLPKDVLTFPPTERVFHSIHETFKEIYCENVSDLNVDFIIKHLISKYLTFNVVDLIHLGNTLSQIIPSSFIIG